MKILIFGGGGQLGQCLKIVLVEKGFTVFAPKKSSVDISDAESVLAYFLKVMPDYVINAAAYTRVNDAEHNFDHAMRVNSDGADNIAQALLKTGGILIQISTDYVFDGSATAPYLENQATSPLNAYGLSKQFGEESILKRMTSNFYILRTAWLYSEYRDNFALRMVEKALNTDENVSVVSDQFGQPTYAGDLAQQIVKIIEGEPKFGIYHGTNSGQASWFSFTKAIFKKLDQSDSRVIEIASTDLQQTVRRPKYSVLSHQQWYTSGIDPMRNWLDALDFALPRLVWAVRSRD